MIVFANPGLIDLAAVTTMGVSVKEGDSPIGFFGTGVKFAIATLLRNDCSVELWRGMDRHLFGVRATEIRGESFDVVTMDGEPLGFTTQLGRKWEPWMAYRELASNCRDEGGTAFVPPAGHESCLREGWTVIRVDGQAIMGVWPDRETILLESAPIAETEYADLHPGVSRYAYYRGVRIYPLPRPSLFTYNIKSKLRLSEDRQAASYWEVELAMERALGALTDAQQLRQALTCGEQFQEHHLDAPRFATPSPEFRAAARELAMGRETNHKANPAAVKHARESAMDDMEPGQSVDLDPIQQTMLDKAKRLLAAAGWAADDYPIIVAGTLGPNICGAARDGKIFLSLLPFSKGTREVAATLLEEYAHLTSGFADETRGFQNWLFDQLLCQAERAAGEPF